MPNIRSYPENDGNFWAKIAQNVVLELRKPEK